MEKERLNHREVSPGELINLQFCGCFVFNSHFENHSSMRFATIHRGSGDKSFSEPCLDDRKGRGLLLLSASDCSLLYFCIGC